MIPVEIKGISVYHGKNIVSNEPYIEHFKKQGKDIAHFLRDVIGRDKRYLVDPDRENNLTMTLAAARDVLKSTGLSGSDLDMIVYSSFLPEYVSPPSSIHLHSALGGKKQCMCYDINVNCAGMLVSLDEVCKYMRLTPSFKRALIVGCDYFTPWVKPDNECCYGHYGDAACAVILEKTDRTCGFLGSRCCVNSEEHNNVLLPGCGVSNVLKVKDRDEMKLYWTPFENVSLGTATDSMNELLAENHLTTDDVRMFCLSQYALSNVKTLRKMMGIDESKSLFIGNRYGYTGTTSPFIVLYESIRNGLVKRGDYVMFWTIGVGSQNIAVLYRY